MAIDNTINGRTPEEIKRGLECYNCKTCPYKKDNCGNVDRDALAYIQQLGNHIGELTEKVQQLKHGWDELFEDAKKLERERDAAVKAMFLKPLSWDEAMGDDAFLEIKGDEYIDAALNLFACCTCDGSVKDGFVYYETHNSNELKLLETDYGKTWRCWARRPTDEEREAVEWEVE